MKKYKFTSEERFDLIMKCRQSGMTDRQWCIENHISLSTFYHWISWFRANGFPDIPEPTRKNDHHKSVKQEVVKLSVFTEGFQHHAQIDCESKLEPNTPVLDSVTTFFTPTAEICGNGLTLRISNDINPEIAKILIDQMRGTL